MGSLRSALDGFTAEDLTSVGDEDLAERVVEVERAMRILEAERARAIAEVDARRTFAADGFLSVTPWLSHRTHVPASAAAQQVRLARALPRMPMTRAALRGGEISSAAGALLVGALEAAPDRFDRSERTLVDAARTLPMRDLRRAIEHWRLLADSLHDGATERRFERRGLFVSTTIDGMVRLDGDLDAETGQTVITALRAVVDASARGADEDARRPAQRRADALGE